MEPKVPYIKTYGDSPAYPLSIALHSNGMMMDTADYNTSSVGMSVRLKIASEQMAAFIAAYGPDNAPHPETVAADSIMYADALIRAHNNTPVPIP